MISLRREADGTMTFQLADTVLRGFDESEFTEGDVRTLSGEMHNVVQAMCMQTRIGRRSAADFYVPLDGDGTPNALGETATCEIMCELAAHNAHGVLPDALWAAIGDAGRRGTEMGLQFAPFYESRLLVAAMALKWLGGADYLSTYWRHVRDADQLVRDLCYFAHIQFDPFMRQRMPGEQANALHDLWADVAAQYGEARARLAPDEVHAVVLGLLEQSQKAQAEADAARRKEEEAAAARKAEEEVFYGPLTKAEAEAEAERLHAEEAVELMALMFARRRLHETTVRRAASPTAVEVLLRFKCAIDRAEALAATMCTDYYASAEMCADIWRKLRHVLLSVPYIVNNDCVHLLTAHTRRFRRLLCFFPYIDPLSAAGLCFYAQFLTEAQMDVYLADLLVHVQARATVSTCDVIVEYLGDDILVPDDAGASYADSDDDTIDIPDLSHDDDDGAPLPLPPPPPRAETIAADAPHEEEGEDEEEEEEDPMNKRVRWD